MAGTVPFPQAVVFIRLPPGFEFAKGHVTTDAATIAEIFEKELQRNVVAVDLAYASAHAADAPKVGS